jgi:hypothetical protein
MTPSQLARLRELADLDEQEWDEDGACPKCHALLYLASPECERRGLCSSCREPLVSAVPELLDAMEAMTADRDSLKVECERLRGALREACDIANAHVFDPPPFAPAAPSSIDGSVKAFTITLDPMKSYRTRARIAELRSVAAKKAGWK